MDTIKTFIETTAQKKILTLKKRVRIVKGGTSGSKTFTILPFLISYASLIPYKRISVVAESIPHLKRGAMRDFLSIMHMTGNYNESKFNKSDRIYTFANKSYIEFFSADDPDKLRGGRRDVLFINECNNVEWESYYNLAIRTEDFIYLDYNPVAEFWADKELTDSDVCRLTLTYLDNEALHPSIVKDIEKAREKGFYKPMLPIETLFNESNIKNTYWANWWRVYGLGLTGSVEGTIYTNWSLIKEVPPEAKLVGVGVDFGFTNDPTVILVIYKLENTFIIDEVLYSTNKLNVHIAPILLNFDCPILCDSSRPDTIADLQRMGVKRAIGANKRGKASAIGNIQSLSEFKITEGSLNTIKEIRGYVWLNNKSNELINEPIGKNDHAMDAMLYGLNSLIENPNYGKYSFL